MGVNISETQTAATASGRTIHEAKNKVIKTTDYGHDFEIINENYFP